MESIDKKLPIRDLDEQSFNERVRRFNQNAKLTMGQAALETSLESVPESEADEALESLQQVIDSKRDDGNHIIAEAEPLAPPVAPKSTPVGRSLLETMTSNPKYNRPKT